MALPAFVSGASGFFPVFQLFFFFGVRVYGSRVQDLRTCGVMVPDCGV